VHACMFLNHNLFDGKTNLACTSSSHMYNLYQGGGACTLFFPAYFLHDGRCSEVLMMTSLLNKLLGRPTYKKIYFVLVLFGIFF